MKKLKKAYLWKKEGKNIRCNLCARRCLIPQGNKGFCLVRENIKDNLYSLNYRKIIAINIDPIEKKPLFHFYPGSKTLSIASPGCNFRCQYCQNWEISQIFQGDNQKMIGQDYSPQEIVDIALQENCPIISYTYTEPTIFFEFAFDTAKLAHKRGIKNTFVTNGYMTKEALNMISPYLNAATVDFKGSGDPQCYKNFSKVYNVKQIYDTLIGLKKNKIHIEITNLIIPKYGDSIDQFKRLVNWISNRLGPDVPFHILRFFPAYKMNYLPPTPVQTLEKFYKIAQKKLKFVYLGNIPGEKENTYCPYCGELLIERLGMSTIKINLKNGHCPKCHKKIPIII